VEEQMNSITVRLSFDSKKEVKLWELNGVSTPVRYVTVSFLTEEQTTYLVEERSKEQGALHVEVHEDAIKILRLKKLKFFKEAWGLAKINGYNGKYLRFVHIYLPRSWKEKKLISIPINNFLRYLLDETWKDF